MYIVLSIDIVKVCLMIFMDTTDVLRARVYTREIVLVYLHFVPRDVFVMLLKVAQH